MGVRIQELPETTGINKEDVLIVEDGQGTKKGTVQQLDETLGVSQLKEDLANKLPKSPTNWEQWTDEEQASAREKIGEDEFEQICDITLEEDSIINIDFGFECKCLIIIIKSPSTNSITGGLTFINKKGESIIFFPTNVLPANTERIAISYLQKQIANKYWISDTSWGANNHAINTGRNRSVLPVINKSISMIASNRSLCAGTEIEIYGVRV